MCELYENRTEQYMSVFLKKQQLVRPFPIRSGDCIGCWKQIEHVHFVFKCCPRLRLGSGTTWIPRKTNYPYITCCWDLGLHMSTIIKTECCKSITHICRSVYWYMYIIMLFHFSKTILLLSFSHIFVGQYTDRYMYIIILFHFSKTILLLSFSLTFNYSSTYLIVKL